MISILTQERILGATLGAVFVAAIVSEQRRAIYRSISEKVGPEQKNIYETKQYILDSKSPDLAHMWNKAVDGTLGSVVAYLSSRGW